MKLNKTMLVLAAAGLLTSAASYAGETLPAVQAEAQVQVTSQLAVSHTLTPERFNAGKLGDNAVVARGAVALTSGGKISNVTLAWNRTVNPNDDVMLSGFGDRAAMRDMSGDTLHAVAYVQLEPVTPVTASVGVKSVVYSLTTPGSEFDYTVNLMSGVNKLDAGNYSLAVVAQVETA
ncbi:hypothetical protein UP57_004806 [Salmonella enterica subsp. enterica serovar Hermannswerder]|uniref:Fimbrial protein n=1 Tax=Salmonella enterica TaxID=28901 RepID=A0A759RBE5_SALER|nr:hypothetical protein [Salmonella enterica subsp. enterica]EAR7457152.1 hypothetical protein [Salmonella enterica]EBQ9894459.1 hypothetical protein [Salmonella enterica subsp. enterica serovar Hvittingfoss]EBS2858325.1 hypothetical protein [Salmonella enterica subsp. enterica serovar Richmond]EBW4543068.1 hypothetical protein [Salmonella enterica subsp. enterica serovar Abony]EBX4347727.1 hypothetical protein [Salmonella enterica subsp. enterica serovar Halle]EBZ4062286.1 hypothetical prote